MKDDVMEVVMAIGESLVSYSSPILIIGNSNGMESLATARIDATGPKEDLIIIGTKRPSWLYAINKSEKKLLYIDNFDKISLDDQRLFIDIIAKGIISGEIIRDIKILIHADNKFPIIPELGEELQIYYM